MHLIVTVKKVTAWQSLMTVMMTTRWLKEAIWIRSRGKDTMKKDEGCHHSHQSLPDSNSSLQPQSSEQDS